MAEISRRSVVQLSVAGLAAGGLATSASARPGRDAWFEAVNASFNRFDPEAQAKILENSGCLDAEEFSLRLSKRFPTLSAGSNAPEKLNLLAQGSPSCPYTKSNSHDKDCSHSRS
ncbi:MULTISPECIES: hypothetical protein [Bradyrhizobium]|uniref:Uncharacterized protein n=1 Tax=Bradyrhizobium ottawaense TaxID=931866 RepID=A0ABV4FW50_9BRAD|nr:MULTISPECIES: hypothetical protein [Bradyrhizobium]MBR1292600.1 hypothetical protein [Bradyrhizobium ottawaense]WLB47804.1 hypothetical protein QIH93_07490 [Bradyrhizobium ottawaense]WQN85141.1 hypothetical protein U7859_12460 [Bradyrhizobium ottawaense]GMO42697.1 hypothetical protein BwSF21_55290 [Bradyrhizobium ottawaense]GMO46324.1 hypothetical protein BwSH14_62890 [Bradyrhizobium ottawaense]